MSGNHDEILNSPAAGQHLLPEDLVLYLLELLAPAERAIVEEHLGSGCAPCREELDAVREDLGVYAMANTPALEPPAASRERLLTGLGVPPLPASPAQPLPTGVQAAPLPFTAPGRAEKRKAERVPVPSRLPSRSRVPVWLGWGLAAALALVAYHFYQARESLQVAYSAQTGELARLSSDEARAKEVLSALTDGSAQRVTLTLTKGAQPPQPTGRATYLPAKGTLIFLASHLQPLPAGKTYELWVIPASGAAPVPAGTFAPDAAGNATVVTAQLEPGIAAKAFGVTLEPDGGSRTPTMPILLAGS